MHQLFNCCVDPLADEGLPTLGLIAQTRRQIRDRTNRPIVYPACKTDHAQRGIPLGNAHPEGQPVPTPLPLTGQLAHALMHANGHAHGTRCRVRAGDSIIKKNHQAIPSETLQRALKVKNQLAHGGMVFP